VDENLRVSVCRTTQILAGAHMHTTSTEKPKRDLRPIDFDTVVADLISRVARHQTETLLWRARGQAITTFPSSTIKCFWPPMAYNSSGTLFAITSHLPCLLGKLMH
jgi:hypothetical protein